MELPSKYLENAVNEISKLPGIGRKTALRLALFLLKSPPQNSLNLAESLTHLVQHTQFCKRCHNLSDLEICGICSNPKRDAGLICVVEDVRDVLAVENTNLFRGHYHVLGGLISPMEGIGPSQLKLESLFEKAGQPDTHEIILALNATMEGDTTNFYIYRRLQNTPIKISTFARGLAVGDQLEYTDEVTLGRSLLNRIPFEQSMKN
ncbi:MAG: recombination mediator RecR [Schleiferiaceae bacterium]|nr:recombination mediator RecR [Schleiferiaceae bacterium]